MDTEDALRVPVTRQERAYREPGVWRDPVAWTIASLVFGAYYAISLFRLLQLAPASWDLGIYTEYVKQLSLLRAPIVDVRGPGFNLLGDHFQIGLAVLAPFFRLFPSPATLLFCQALATALSVFPVIAAGSVLLGRPSGRTIGFAYGFCWSLQQMIDFDFHEIALAVPLLAFALSALVRGRVRATALWAMPLVLIKEDQGFTVAAIGALLVFSGVRALADGSGGSGRRGQHRLGRAAVRLGPGLVGAGDHGDHSALQLAARLLLLEGRRGRRRQQRLLARRAGGADGVRLAAQAADRGPAAAADRVRGARLADRADRAAQPGAPVHLDQRGLLGHPVCTTTPRSPRSCSSPRSRRSPAGAPSTPAAASSAGPAGGLAGVLGDRLGGLWISVRGGLARHGAAMMAAVAVALAFQFPVSNLWHGSTYTISPQVAADDAAMAVVPDGATVQTTLNLLAPLAARTDTFWLGNAGNPLTQYIVFDGKNSGYSPAPANVPAFIHQLYPTAGYQQIFTRSDVYVFRR